MDKAPRIILKILLVIAAYFVGLILSISVTTLPHINLALRHQLKYSSELAEEITGEQPPVNLEVNNKLMLYSPDKELLWEKDLESNPIPYRCEKLTRQYFAKHLGEEFSRPTIIIEKPHKDNVCGIFNWIFLYSHYSSNNHEHYWNSYNHDSYQIYECSCLNHLCDRDIT